MNLKLREYREKAGLTQEQLGDVLDKSFSTIKAWEAGKSFPNAKMIWRMCEYFGTDPNTFMGWYDEHPAESSPGLTRSESLIVSDYRESTPRGETGDREVREGETRPRRYFPARWRVLLGYSWDMFDPLYSA